MGIFNNKVTSKKYEKSKELKEVRDYVNSLYDLTNKLSEKDEKIQSIQEDYKKIFNLFSDSVVIIDAEGNVIDVNKKAHIYLRELNCEKIIGEKWQNVMKIMGCDWNNSIERQVIESDVLTERSKEVFISDINKHFLISIVPIRKENKSDDYYIFTAKNITKIKEREKQLIQKNDLIKYIDLISDTFHRNFNINYIMEKIVEILGNVEDVDVVYIYKNCYDIENNLYADPLKWWTKDKLNYRKDNIEYIYYSDFPRWEEYFKINHIVCGNINSFPKNERLYLEKENIKSICVVPIYTPQEWWGFIGFDSTEKFKQWSFDEERILKIAANIIGSGIYQWSLRNLDYEIINKTCINF